MINLSCSKLQVILIYLFSQCAIHLPIEALELKLVSCHQHLTSSSCEVQNLLHWASKVKLPKATFCPSES